jgi:hypothetical protein
MLPFDVLKMRLAAPFHFSNARIDFEIPFPPEPGLVIVCGVILRDGF